MQATILQHLVVMGFVLYIGYTIMDISNLFDSLVNCSVDKVSHFSHLIVLHTLPNTV